MCHYNQDYSVTSDFKYHIDDAVILGLSLYFLEKDLMKYKQWKDMNG